MSEVAVEGERGNPGRLGVPARSESLPAPSLIPLRVSARSESRPVYEPAREHWRGGAADRGGRHEGDRPGPIRLRVVAGGGGGRRLEPGRWSARGRAMGRERGA
jgi:hypothetical protein